MKKKPSKIKLVITGTRGIPNILGGVETHCEELFPLIAEKGYDVTVIRRKQYVNDDLQSYKDVKLYDLNVPKKKSLEAIIHTFKAILVAKFTLKCDIIHIHAIGPALMVPFARLLGMKVVFTHHGFDYDRAKWGRFAKFILKLGERFGVKYSNRVIVISNVIKEFVEQKYNRKDINLIYNGVPEPQFTEDQDLFNKLGIENQKYILALGRFVPEKNFHHLVSAFKNADLKDYKLVIAGDAQMDDSYSSELKSSARENNVILPGFVKGKSLTSLLSNSRLFVLPSSHEGLPISLLEAMSYNLPVLVSDIPANLEVALDRKSYFKTGNIEDLTQKIINKLDQKEDKIMYNMDKYKWHQIADMLSDIYLSLL